MKSGCPESLKEVALLVGQGQSLQASLANFLDLYKRNPGPQAFDEIPCSIGLHGDAFLAATAEYLALALGVVSPEWSNDPGRVVEPPVFPTNNKNYRKLLLEECPSAFKRRGLIISSNALTRV